MWAAEGCSGWMPLEGSTQVARGEGERLLEDRVRIPAQEEQFFLSEQDHILFSKRVVSGEPQLTWLLGDKNEKVTLQFIWKKVLGHTQATTSQSNGRGS